MAKGADVLRMLRPDGGWVIQGDDFHSIQWDESVEPVSEEEFNQGFSKVDTFKAQAVAKATAAKSALLEKLGITEEEAKLLLS
jgi:hypothetical protein